MQFFQLSLEGEATNEQWRTEALMFETAGQALCDDVSMDSPTWQEAYQIARLFLLAHHAYQRASAATIGHKKTESYERLAAEAELRALEWFQQLIVLRPDLLTATLREYLESAEKRIGIIIL